jgi:DNA-binding XRE family transcriptional regulator
MIGEGLANPAILRHYRGNTRSFTASKEPIVVDSRPTPAAVRRSLTTFGTHLREWRLLNDLTADQVAERANVSTDTITRLERGRGATLTSTFQVLRALGLLDSVVASTDPLETAVGRLRAQQKMPTRARRRVR